MVKRPPQRVQRGNDGRVLVGHHPHLGQHDALLGQLLRQMVHVGIARSAGQDLVSDHQHGGGGVGHGAISLQGAFPMV